MSECFSVLDPIKVFFTPLRYLEYSWLLQGLFGMFCNLFNVPAVFLTYLIGILLEYPLIHSDFLCSTILELIKVPSVIILF